MTQLSNEFLRSLLDAAFSREELIDLCFDHFPDLHEDAEHQSKQKIIRSLISYCRYRDQIADLVELVKRRNFAQYKRYASYITGAFSSTGPGIVRITVEIPNDEKLITDLLRNLAGLLEVREEVRLVKVEMGSLQLTIVLHPEAIAKLLGFDSIGDSRLKAWGITDIVFVQPDLVGVSLPRSYLGGSNLASVDFNHAKLSRAWLNRAVLTNADFRGAELDGANLFKSKLMFADLSWANLFAANLNMANLYHAVLLDTVLLGADLLEANLERANLQRAIMIRANLRGARLHGADLRQANLHRANLANADLSQAILKEADLREADVRQADLTGVDLSQTHLRNADLRQVSLDSDQLFWALERGAIIDDLLPVPR